MLAVVIVAAFLTIAYSEIPVYEPVEFDIDCIVIDDASEEDNNVSRSEVGDDFERDVYDHMRDPDIVFPPEEVTNTLVTHTRVDDK